MLSTTHVTDNFSCDHLKCKITKMGNLRPLFIYFSLFYKQSIVNNCSIKVAVTGFELGSSGFGSDRSANCATTTSILPFKSTFILSFYSFISSLAFVSFHSHSSQLFPSFTIILYFSLFSASYCLLKL